MSKLRKQLQQARHEYQHQRYPGNLASEVLGDAGSMSAKKGSSGRSSWMGPLAIAAGLCVLASAVVFVSQRQRANNDIAIVTDPVPTSSTGTSPVLVTDQAEVLAVREKTEIEAEQERWSLVPSQVDDLNETSFSIVPAYQALTMNEASVDGIEDSTQQQ